MIEPLALLEIATDQQPEAARQLEHPHQRVVFGALRLLLAPVDRFGPARLVEDARCERADIAGQSLALERRHQIKTRPRPARAPLDHQHQPADAALPVLLGQAGDLGIDRIGDLFGDETAGVEREITEQERGKQRENRQIDQRQLERGGAKKLTERRHGSILGLVLMRFTGAHDGILLTVPNHLK